MYGRTAFDYAAETTSFIMLHSPLDRLKKREEVCRALYVSVGGSVLCVCDDRWLYLLVSVYSA